MHFGLGNCNDFYVSNITKYGKIALSYMKDRLVI